MQKSAITGFFSVISVFGLLQFFFQDNLIAVPVLEKTKKFEASELLPYVESLNSSASESEWRAKVESAKSELESRWNQEVDSEIQSIVDSEIRSDALNSNEEYKEADRAELNIQKETARSQWLFDVAQFLQAKLNEFLNLKSSEKENSITENKTELISSIDPNVEKITEHPQHIDRPNAGQATQSYYDGKNLWDSKWSDLLEKRNSWVIDSENILVNGFDEWNLSIQKLFTEKENYLNALNQREFQWRENGKIIEDRERVAREWMRSLVGNLRGQFGSLQGDENLTAAFGDMTNLLNRMDDALDNNLPLENLAREAALFFEAQKNYAKIQENYWDNSKSKTGIQREEGFRFDFAVGQARINKGLIYDWGAYNSYGGGVKYISDDGMGGNSWEGSCVLGGGCMPKGWYNLFNGFNNIFDWAWPVLNFDNNLPSSANFTTIVPRKVGLLGETGGYSVDVQLDLEKYRNLRKMWRAMDESHVMTSNGLVFDYRTDFIDFQNPNHPSVANVVYNMPAEGTLNSQMSELLYMDANGVEQKLTFRNGVDFNNLPAQRFTIQTTYTYTDNNAISNRDYWASLGTEFNNWADKFTLAETALKNWSEKKNSYNVEFETKLSDLNTLRDKATTEFDLRISSMISQRDEWLKNTYGYSLDPFSNEGDNPDSEYRRGVREWDEKVRAFQVAELGWFQNAKVVLENSVEDPVNGEKAFSETLENFTSGVQSNIVSSESNSDDLEKRAKSLTDAYYYRQAEELTKQEIANKNNEVSWNDYGSVLSADIKKSFERMEAYSKAEMDAMDRVNFLTASISPDVENLPYIEGDFTGLESDVSAFQEKQKFWQSEIDGSSTGSETGSAGFGFEKRKSAANLKLGELESFRADLAKAGDLKLEAMDTESGYLARMEEFFKKSEEFQSLSVKYESEGSFDEAKYYLKLSGDKLAEGKRILGEETEKLTTYLGEEVTNRTLNETRESFLNYIESLEAKTFVSSVTISAELKKNQEDKKSLEEREGEFTDAKEFLASARRIAALGEGFGENTKYFQARAAELMNRDLPKELLADLKDTLGEFDDWTPVSIAKSDVKEKLADSEKELADSKEEIEKFLAETSRLVLDDGDLKNLYSALDSFAGGLNFAANSTLIKYADMVAVKIREENVKKNEELQKNLFEEIRSAGKYQYLRDANFSISKNEEGFIFFTRQIDNGDFRVNGDVRSEGSYSPLKQYQRFSIQTKLDLPALKIDFLNIGDLSEIGFNQNLISGVTEILAGAKESYDEAFARFSDKDSELIANYDFMKSESDQYTQMYTENKKQTAGSFAKLETDLNNSFLNITGHAKSEYEKNKFVFRTESNYFKSDFEYKTTVMMPTSYGPVPVEATNGMMHVEIRKSFEFSAMDFGYNRSGEGFRFTTGLLEGVYGKYNKYINESIKQKEDAPNPALTAILGMIGGTGNLGQRFNNFSREYARSALTTIAANDPNIKALSSMTGVPVGVITSLGNQRFDKAVESYAIGEITKGIEAQTGIKGISSAIQKAQATKDAKDAMKGSFAYNLGMFVGGVLQVGTLGQASQVGLDQRHIAREWYRNRDTIETVTDVGVAVALTAMTVASAGALTGASVALGSAYTAYKVAEGAVDGGIKGAIAGAVSAGLTIAGAYTGGVAAFEAQAASALYEIGMVTEAAAFSGGSTVIGGNASYTYQNGFSANIGFGRGGLGLTLGFSDREGYNGSAGVNFGTLNAGVRYSDATGPSANVGYNLNQGTSSIGFSYNNTDRFGANYSQNFSGGYNAGLTYNQRTDFGVTGGYNISGTTQTFNNTGLGFSFNRIDGFNGSVSYLGTNAINLSRTGLMGNANYSADSAYSQGLAQGTELLRALRERAEAERRQREASQEQGSNILEGAVLEAIRRQEEMRNALQTDGFYVDPNTGHTYAIGEDGNLWMHDPNTGNDFTWDANGNRTEFYYDQDSDGNRVSTFDRNGNRISDLNFADYEAFRNSYGATPLDAGVVRNGTSQLDNLSFGEASGRYSKEYIARVMCNLTSLSDCMRGLTGQSPNSFAIELLGQISELQKSGWNINIVNGNGEIMSQPEDLLEAIRKEAKVQALLNGTNQQIHYGGSAIRIGDTVTVNGQNIVIDESFIRTNLAKVEGVQSNGRIEYVMDRERTSTWSSLAGMLGYNINTNTNLGTTSTDVNNIKNHFLNNIAPLLEGDSTFMLRTTLARAVGAEGHLVSLNSVTNTGIWINDPYFAQVNGNKNYTRQGSGNVLPTFYTWEQVRQWNIGAGEGSIYRVDRKK